MQNREELTDVLSRITPEDAATTEALMAASAHAVAEYDEFLPELRARLAILTSPLDRKVEIARETYRFLREKRNAWLKQHGAYNRG